MSGGAAGVDGCRAGWIAVMREGEGAPRAAVFPRFASLLDALPENAVIAVDMPIGLPDRLGPGGRGPEVLARRVLGERRSSVFAIPSRRAVYAEPEPFAGEARRAAHARTSEVARQTSDPPRGVSIQAFGLFPKIREIDGLLRADPALCHRVIECHPELAFCRLNGGWPMQRAKKTGGRADPAGMSERRALLLAHGIATPLLAGRFPGAGEDDLLDAAVLLLVAEQFARGEAVPMPDPPHRDGHGIPVAIWS